MKDKIAVITGAASGIGFGLPARFARDGARVVVSEANAAAAPKDYDACIRAEPARQQEY